MADSFSEDMIIIIWTDLKLEHLSLLGMQNILLVADCFIAASCTIIIMLLNLNSIIMYHVKGSTDSGFFCLYCDMLKLYYMLPPGYISRSISSWYGTISKKSAGN